MIMDIEQEGVFGSRVMISVCWTCHRVTVDPVASGAETQPALGAHGYLPCIVE